MEKETESIFTGAKWIWADNNEIKNDWVIFRCKFNLEKPLKTAIAHIAAETRYFLYVNGKTAVFDGGLNRESKYGCGYYDTAEIGRMLVKGDNAIVIIAQYVGLSGKDGVCAGKAGMLFECAALGIKSDDESFTCFRNSAYLFTDTTSKMYVGSNIFYDATRENQLDNVLDPAFGSNLFIKPAVCGVYPCPPFNELLPRSIPSYRFSSPVNCKKYSKTDRGDGTVDYTVSLGEAKFVSPYFQISAAGQEKITVKTDRYETHGAAEDANNVYKNQKIEYICKPLAQTFEGLLTMSGEKLIFNMPSSVKVLELGYIESAYDYYKVTSFDCDCDDLTRLMEKCETTLDCCMRANFYDTPDRERTMWLLDSSIEAEALMTIGDEKGVMLVKKTIEDILNNIKDGIFMGNVPGICPVEIPSHNLIALSEFGIFSSYLKRVHDADLIDRLVKPMVGYLELWEEEGGLVKARDGNSRWYDSGCNIDETLLINALYYAALRYTRELCDLAGEISHDGFIDRRLKSIRDAVTKMFDGTGYKSGEFYDERANAWVVLSGMVDDEKKHPALKKLLVTLNGCSPYMEGYVLKALGAMNASDLAYGRMLRRYYTLIRNDSSTLYEDFNILGSKCHGWSVAPLAFAYEYLAGIKISEGASKAVITPNLASMDSLSFSVETERGKIAGKYRRSGNKTEYILDNGTNLEVILRLGKNGDRLIKLNKGRNRFND